MRRTTSLPLSRRRRQNTFHDWLGLLNMQGASASLHTRLPTTHCQPFTHPYLRTRPILSLEIVPATMLGFSSAKYA